MIQVDILRDDIFNINADALVNPANQQPTLRFGSHINEAVKNLGGPQVVHERRAQGKIQLGEVVVTTAGDLPFKCILHAAVLNVYDFNPLYLLRLRQRTSDLTLQRATRCSLLKAMELSLESVVFSAMGAGVGAMPSDRCAHLMFSEIAELHQELSQSTVNRIIFALKSPEVFDAFCNARAHSLSVLF